MARAGTLGVVLTPLVVAVIVTAAALTAWAAWFVVRDRAVILRQLWGACVVEALLLAQVVVGAFLVGGARAEMDAWVFWGYQITILFILPVAAVWAFAERTRWSSVVLAVAGLTVIFLEYRLLQIWGF